MTKAMNLPLENQQTAVERKIGKQISAAVYARTDQMVWDPVHLQFPQGPWDCVWDALWDLLHRRR